MRTPLRSKPRARQAAGERTLWGERQRALLALLLLHANEVVSSDRLIDELFGGQATETAANALQAAVSRLRRVLEKGDSNRIVVTRPPGYVLQVAPYQVDLARFERLLEEGRRALSVVDPLGASAIVREALGLWRGPLLADLGSQEFAEQERRALGEPREETGSRSAAGNRATKASAQGRIGMVCGDMGLQLPSFVRLLLREIGRSGRLAGGDPDRSRCNLHLYRTVADVHPHRREERGQCGEDLRERLHVVAVGCRHEDRLERERRQTP
jgi:Bacterial transcriptional activator domain